MKPMVSESLVSIFAFKWVNNVCRYAEWLITCPVILIALSRVGGNEVGAVQVEVSCDPYRLKATGFSL